MLLYVCSVRTTYVLESVQDFLIKLGIEPLMHLLEISTFSLNIVIVRLTKIMNRADKIGHIFKGQIISKRFFLAEDSPIKRTKTRRILVKTNSFVRFLGKSWLDKFFSKLTDL